MVDEENWRYDLDDIFEETFYDLKNELDEMDVEVGKDEYDDFEMFLDEIDEGSFDDLFAEDFFGE